MQLPPVFYAIQCQLNILRAKTTRNYLLQSLAKITKHLSGQQSSSQSKPVVAVDASICNKSFAAQALWLMKVAENDLTLHDCGNTPAL